MNMDKTSQKIMKITKDPKRLQRGKKSHEMYMKKLKEDVLRNIQLSTSSSAGNSLSSTSFFTGNSTTRSSDTCVCGVGTVAVLTIRVCAFFLYIKKSSQSSNKEQAREPIKPT